MLAAAYSINPIGVFDSGVGGLSILRELTQKLNNQSFVYFSDAANAPYGECKPDFIIQRSLSISNFLIKEHHAKAIVVACNSATATAIQVLRQHFPTIPFIGVEPAIKPALQISTTKHIAVLATSATLLSQKYQSLAKSLAHLGRIRPVPCIGLAAAIEQHDIVLIENLCERYLHPLLKPTNEQPHPTEIDTIVLGCTHYPLALPVMQKIIQNQPIQFIDPAQAVAAQTARQINIATDLKQSILDERKHSIASTATVAATTVTLLSSGEQALLTTMAERHLQNHLLKKD